MLFNDCPFQTIKVITETSLCIFKSKGSLAQASFRKSEEVSSNCGELGEAKVRARCVLREAKGAEGMSKKWFC